MSNHVLHLSFGSTGNWITQKQSSDMNVETIGFFLNY